MYYLLYKINVIPINNILLIKYFVNKFILKKNQHGFYKR